MLHIEVGVCELRNRTSQVIDAVRAGERVGVAFGLAATPD